MTGARGGPLRPRAAAGVPAGAMPPLLVGLAGAAWLALALWGASPAARWLGHGERLDGAQSWLALGLFLVGWTLMVMAMMLPTAGGLLRDFALLVRARPERNRLRALVAAGFLGAWVVMGALFRVLDESVHSAVASSLWLQARPRLLGATVLVLAGLYQFTPLKHRCLAACRTPRSFIYRFWRGGRPAGDALRVGLAYGRSCIGCCWALMLVMFALGTASLAWMFGLGALMAVEKGTAVGHRLSVPIGLVLVAAGVVTAFGL